MSCTRVSIQVAIIMAASLMLWPAVSAAQFYGGGGYGFGGPGMGMGMGFYGGGIGGGIEGGPGAFVTVKYGEKVYDAVYDDLIEYKVTFVQVPADTIGVHYFDDGSNGDEVAYDGMPSYIIINKDSYLGPFAIKYKNMLERAVNQAKELGAQNFYSLGVATKNENSQVTQLSDFEEQLEAFIQQNLNPLLSQFEGYDTDTYRKRIDPSLFDSLEGFGGAFGGGGFGAGGVVLPGLPPPPGLPNPLEQGFGQQQQQQFPDTGTGTPPPPEGQRSGIFRPIDQANQTVEGLNALNSIN